MGFAIKNEDIMMIISPKIFNLDGRAMFVKITSIHDKDIRGIMIGDALISSIFRVF